MRVLYYIRIIREIAYQAVSKFWRIGHFAGCKMTYTPQ